jgi:hypothetical protein
MLKAGAGPVAEADWRQGIAPDGAPSPDDRPRPGASLREADRATPRRNLTGPVHDFLSAGAATSAYPTYVDPEPAHAPTRPPTAYDGVGWSGGGAGGSV